MKKILKILRKKRCIYGSLVLFIGVFILCAFWYDDDPSSLALPIAATSLLLESVYVIWCILADMSDSLYEQIRQYRDENNLASGVLACIFITIWLMLAPWLFCKVFRFNVPDELVALYTTYIQTLIAVVPAVVGLLGVRYTIVVENQNRKEDLRLSEKPFWRIEYKAEGFVQEESSSPHEVICSFRVTNISSNIAIPIGFGVTGTNKLSFWYSYMPLANNQTRETLAFINNELPFTSSKIQVCFYYKDVLGNYYVSKMILKLSNSSEYRPPIQAEDSLCDTATVCWLKETAFSKSEDYWEDYSSYIIP